MELEWVKSIFSECVAEHSNVRKGVGQHSFLLDNLHIRMFTLSTHQLNDISDPQSLGNQI